MKYLKTFNESFLGTILLSLSSSIFLIKYIIKLIKKRNNQNAFNAEYRQESIQLISRLKTLLSHSIKMEVGKDDDKFYITVQDPITISFILNSKNKTLCVTQDLGEMKLTNNEYISFVTILNTYLDITNDDKKLFPKLASSEVVDSKYSEGVTKLSSDEINIIKSNLGSDYELLREVTDFKWTYQNVEKNLDISSAIGISSKKNKNNKPKTVIIIKNCDDWFIITEWYGDSSNYNWSRYLIADQIEEIKNYIKSL